MNTSIGHRRLNDELNHKVQHDGGFSAIMEKDGTISMMRLLKEKSDWVLDIKHQYSHEDGFSTSERLRIGSIKKFTVKQAAEIANKEDFGGAKFQIN